jgi:hypothetical protein
LAILARKIARAKWEQNPELGDGEIAADAVTGDLRTTGNALSLWRCASSAEDDLKRAVLALAAAADRPDKLDIVYFDEVAVREAGLAIQNTPGNTPVASLREHHVDVKRLDILRLGTMARLVAQALRADAALRMTSREVVELVVHAVRTGLLPVEDLKDQMKTKVAERLAERS